MVQHSQKQHCRPLAKSDRGASSITTLIFGVIAVSLMYSAYKIIPFYYCYLELQNQMQAAARVASTESDAELRKKLIYQIKKFEIPVSPEKLIITRNDDDITMRLTYEEIFYVPLFGKDYDIHTFKFDAIVTEQY